MKRSLKKLAAVLMIAGALLVLHTIAALAQDAAQQAKADQIKLLFDGSAVIVMFAWGLVHKYAPFLAKIPNELIPWVNLGGYILIHLGQLEAAHAGTASQLVSVVPDIVSVALGAFTNATWARQLYEGFGRSLLEGWLGLKKPTVPAATPA